MIQVKPRLARDAAAWTEFENRLLDNARRAERALSIALKANSTERQVQAGSIVVQGLFEELRFMTVCRSRSQAERDFITEVWRDREDRALGLLVARAFEILGAPTRGRARPSRS